MAARTTALAVQAVLMRDYDGESKPSLTPFIDTANSVVNRLVRCAASKNLVVAASDLELIERWLSAHFYAVSDKPYTSKSTAGASASFSGQTGMGLEATLYGQHAKLVDWTNCLDNLDKNKVAGAFWLGKPPSEQIPYEDRD